MKGFIFTEFLEMVAEVFSPTMVEEIIAASDLPTQGAYTTVGTYNYEELIRLVDNLSKLTGMLIVDLEIAYGKYLFKKLLQNYSAAVAKTNSTFEFLRHVDNHVHVEVLKLYPDSELPRFTCHTINPKTMTMEYRSNHPFSALAEGLILGCAEYFNEKIQLHRQEINPPKEKLNETLFTITLKD